MGICGFVSHEVPRECLALTHSQSQSVAVSRTQSGGRSVGRSVGHSLKEGEGHYIGPEVYVEIQEMNEPIVLRDVLPGLIK